MCTAPKTEPNAANAATPYRIIFFPLLGRFAVIPCKAVIFSMTSTLYAHVYLPHLWAEARDNVSSIEHDLFNWTFMSLLPMIEKWKSLPRNKYIFNVPIPSRQALISSHPTR